jgi:hypothetical protein
MRKTLLVLLILVVLIAGCVNQMDKSDNSSGQAKLPKLEGVWTVTLNQSGGLLGLSRNLIVTSSEEAILFDQKTMSYLPGALKKDQVAKFSTEYENVAITNVTKKNECADCFQYDLLIEVGKTKLNLTYNDLDAGQNGLGALTQYMVSLMDEAARK